MFEGKNIPLDEKEVDGIRKVTVHVISYRNLHKNVLLWPVTNTACKYNE